MYTFEITIQRKQEDHYSVRKIRTSSLVERHWWRNCRSVWQRRISLLGPSGSGKSSLVLAGLVPELQRGSSDFQLAYLTPGNDPLTALEEALKEPNPTTLLVVDQFEELFTLCPDVENRKDFLACLLVLPEQMQVIITMRADFWGECAIHPQLRQMMQDHQELIAPMTTDELRSAMEKQARKVSFAIRG